MQVSIIIILYYLCVTVYLIKLYNFVCDYKIDVLYNYLKYNNEIYALKFIA